jgi:monovalent cation:H+ antiporter, CPA1 family
VMDIRVLTFLLFAACAVGMVARRLNFPYAVALVLAGLAIGLTGVLPQVRLEPHTLLFVLLPPLLFEAGLNLRWSLVRRGALPIALLAVVGTVASAGLVAAAVHYMVGIAWQIALMFGALISATDPVSIVAVFRHTRTNPLLIAIVEAEALFNDSVAVVLFAVASASDTSLGGLFHGGVQFVLLLGGGIALGVAVGYLASQVTRTLDDHLIETLITLVAAYGSYLTAEMVHVSGVVAVTCAALVIGNHGFDTALSERAKVSAAHFWELAAFLVTSVVFLLVGIEVTSGGLLAHVWAILVSYLVVLGARAAACYGLGAVANRPSRPLPWAWRHLLVWGGLRGALGMALALSVPAEMPGHDTLVALTFGVVLLSLVIQGSTSHPVAHWLAGDEEPGVTP